VGCHEPGNPRSSNSQQNFCPWQREIVMNSYSTLLQQFLYDEQAVTAIEYGLIAALIAVVIIASVQLVGTNLSAVFSNIAAAL
jgi:pilus assembly protein Flp/PilA